MFSTRTTFGKTINFLTVTSTYLDKALHKEKMRAYDVLLNRRAGGGGGGAPASESTSYHQRAGQLPKLNYIKE